MEKLINFIEKSILQMGILVSTVLISIIFAVFSLLIVTISEMLLFDHIRDWSMALSVIVPLILVPTFIFMFAQLLTKVNNLNQQLEHRANYDNLTGVYNRHFLLESINLELSRFSRHGNRFTILFIDLDDFKPINDKFGHKVGDETLAVLGKTILSCLRDIDILGRYGGDEFLVCLPETTPDKGLIIAQRIQQNLRKALAEINTHEINITASIGLYSPENSAIDSEYIIEHADKALYRAKMKGKNRIEEFS